MTSAGGFAGAAGNRPVAFSFASPRGASGKPRAVHTLERAISEAGDIAGQNQPGGATLVGLLSCGTAFLRAFLGVAKMPVRRPSLGWSADIAHPVHPGWCPPTIIGTRIYRQGREEFDTEPGTGSQLPRLADLRLNPGPARCSRRC